MNTLKKGDKFEKISLELVKKLIEDEELFHLSKYLKIFTRKDKGYYSNLRKKEIFFDLTIEVWPPKAKRYSLIYIIECKNYDKRVPVDDIEEFHHKIQQVSGVNVKGILIVNSPLQEGAYNVAEATGMMVIQAETPNNYEIILHKSSHKIDNVSIPLIKNSNQKIVVDEGIKIIEKIIDTKVKNIFITKGNNSRVNYNIDKLSKKQIEELAKAKLFLIDPKVISEGRSMSYKKLKDFLQEKEQIEIIEFDNDDSILGWCNLNIQQIGISKKTIGTNRELFILGHEYGHFILHQKLSIGQNEYDNFSDPFYNFKTEKHDLKNPRNWIEWQANYFSSCLIIPKVQFMARLWWCQDRLEIRRGKIYLDDQYHNIKKFNELITKMSYILNVSKTSVIYKLKELNLLDENTNMKSIGKILNENNLNSFI